MTLSILPSPILRLVLLGGGGLAPAYGDLLDPWGSRWAWHPVERLALRGSVRGGAEVLGDTEKWSLDLSPGSPWPARLALVAALLSQSTLEPWLIDEAVAAKITYILAYRKQPPQFRVELAWWTGYSHRVYWWGTLEPDRLSVGIRPGLLLSTLAGHLATHDSHAALLLALWDVPEVRARVEEMVR